MALSPILLTVYDRKSHLEKSVNSLAACKEAKDTYLYIASDAAGRKRDCLAVEEVRQYINNIEGFKEVIPIFRERNLGSVENAIRAINFVFEKHDTIIRLEDDVVVGSGFLGFMNQGLKRYGNEPQVVGVCGYLPPEVKNQGGYPFFLHRRAAYGFGMWKEKEVALRAKFERERIRRIFKNLKFFREYERRSPHVAASWPSIVNGSESPADIMAGIIMQKEGLLALYPPTSITKSIGHDGSGLHSEKRSDRVKQDVSHKNYGLPIDLIPKENIQMAEIMEKNRRQLGQKTKNYFVFFMVNYVPFGNHFFFLARKILHLAKRRRVIGLK